VYLNLELRRVDMRLDELGVCLLFDDTPCKPGTSQAIAAVKPLVYFLIRARLGRRFLRQRL
jgi:hypothetical protein